MTALLLRTTPLAELFPSAASMGETATYGE